MRGGSVARYWGFALAVGLVVATGLFWLQSSRAPSDDEQWAVIGRYCIDCHNSADLTGDLSFEGIGPGDIPLHAATFETAVRKLRGQLMPPPGSPRPSAAEADDLIAWLENTLDTAETLPRAGHVPVQRLDRSEFAATVEDLLAEA